jgi:hypothetical protein
MKHNGEILGRLFHRLFSAFIAANGNFPAADRDLDAAVGYFPVADRAFNCVHSAPPFFQEFENSFAVSIFEVY